MQKKSPPRLIENILIYLIDEKKYKVLDLAKMLSLATNKVINGNKILLMRNGKVSVKTWWFIPLLSFAMKNGWLPKNISQWEYVAMKTLSAKKVYHQIDKKKLFNTLHALTGIPIKVFVKSFEEI